MVEIETTSDLRSLEETLAALGVRARQAVGAALYGIGQEIITDAQEHYVPVDLGVLKDSGMVGEPEYSAGEIAVSMGFGGAASDYAIAVHEHLSEHSPVSWKAAEASGHGVHFTVGGPKYLERPFLDKAPHVDDELADALRAELGI